MTAPDWIVTAQSLSLPGLAVAAVLAAIVAFIKALPQLKRVQMEGDNSLRHDLLARVDVLESRVSSLEKELALERALRADVEHDLVNERWSLDALILQAETNPDKFLEQIPNIKEGRRQHRERMALKRGAREGAAIQEAGQ